MRVYYSKVCKCYIAALSRAAENTGDFIMSFFEKLFGSFSDKELKRINPLKDKVLALEPEMQKLTDEQLQAKTTEFKARLEKAKRWTTCCPRLLLSAVRLTGVCWA